MTKPKLSQAQKEAIRKLREGVGIIWVGGINAHFFWRDNLKNARFETVVKLREFGLIEWDNAGYKNYENIRLTDLGREIEI